MSECGPCGNRERFDKKVVVSFPVEYDAESGDLEWGSDDYEFGYSLTADCQTCGDEVRMEAELVCVCADCGSNDVDEAA